MLSHLCKMLFLLSISIILFSCGSSSSSSSNDSNPAIITVSEIRNVSTSADAGQTFDLTYDIESSANTQNTVVSFYLTNTDTRATDTDNQSYKELLGVDIIENLSANSLQHRTASFRVPAGLSNGQYNIDAYVNEYLNEDTSYIRAEATVTYDNSTYFDTKIKITNVEMEEPQILLDPYSDLKRGLEAANIVAVLGLDSIADNETLRDMLLEGLVSEAEINGTVTVGIDGALPVDPVNLSFEYSLDNGATWNNLGWWDDELKKYSDYVTIEFNDFDNGTNEQRIDFDIDISPSIMKNIFNAIISSGSLIGELEDFTGLKTRIKAVSGTLETTYDLNIPVFTAQANLNDFDIIKEYSDNLTSCLQDIPACIQTYSTIAQDGITDNISVTLSRTSDLLTSSESPIEAYTKSLPSSIINRTRSDETRDRVSDKYWSRWSGNKKYFKVGAKYEHKFAIYNGNPRTGYYGAYAKMRFNIPMYIFYKRINIVDAYVRASAYAERPRSDEALYTGYKYYFDIFADTVFSGEQWAGNLTYEVGNYDNPKSIKKTLADAWLWVGPVPFHVEAGVKGDLKYKLSLNLHMLEGVTLSSTFPSSDLKLYVEGGPDIYVVGWGITADLGLIRDYIISSINFDYTYSNTLNRMTGAKYNVVVTNRLKTIWGEFSLYYKYWSCSFGSGCHKKTRRRTIYNTRPYRNWTYTLYSTSEKLFNY